MVWQSHHQQWNYHVFECFHLLTTPLCHMSIWLVTLTKAGIWRHKSPDPIKVVISGMVFEKGHYRVDQMFQRTEMDGMKPIKHDNSCRTAAIHNTEVIFSGFNYLIFLVVPDFLCIILISLNRKYCLLEVQLIVLQLPSQWTPFPNWHGCHLETKAIILLDWVQVNVLDAWSHPCVDHWIRMPHLFCQAQLECSRVEIPVKSVTIICTTFPKTSQLCIGWLFMAVDTTKPLK